MMPRLTNKGRETATNRIKELLVKLGSMKPSESFDVDEIHATRLYLGWLKETLEQEKA